MTSHMTKTLSTAKLEAPMSHILSPRLRHKIALSLQTLRHAQPAETTKLTKRARDAVKAENQHSGDKANGDDPSIRSLVWQEAFEKRTVSLAPFRIHTGSAR